MLILGHLGKIANHFRGERTPELWKMLFEDYAADLEGISAAHLTEITDDWRRTQPWFPKVSDLMGLWNTLRYREGEQLRRARVLLCHEQPKPWEAL